MKELYPANENCPNVAYFPDGKIRVKQVGVRTYKDPDGNKDYQGFWCYRLPKNRTEQQAVRVFQKLKG